MSARIDIDVLESIISTYSKREKEQTRLYGVLMGIYEGNNGVHVKQCIFGLLTEQNYYDDKREKDSDDNDLATDKV